MSRTKTAALVIIIALILDQTLKILIKSTMMLGEEIRITDWFILHFTENNGMAFGMELGGKIGKLILSLFRLVAIGAIAWYVWKLISQKAPYGLIISLSLVLAGAMGNVLDSAFYGLMFTDSHYRVAELFAAEGGYASLLHGKVVDMFYFPIIKGYLPAWSPFAPGEYFVFFQPIFNLADSFITVGVSILLIFQKSFFKDLA